MQDKGQLSGRTFTFDQDVANIPTNVPRIEQKTSKDAQECFPPFARTSIYQEDRISFEELFSTTLSSEKQKILENRQRIAINQRLSQLSGSLQITQVNTGKIGFRVEGGEPLARFSSGFDRDYVIYRLMHAETQKERSALFKELTGLNEIDTTTQEQLIAKMEREFSLNASSKTKAKRLISILRAIEILKLESLCPKSKVKR
jgi:hypothetical protein